MVQLWGQAALGQFIAYSGSFKNQEGDQDRLCWAATPDSIRAGIGGCPGWARLQHLPANAKARWTMSHWADPVTLDCRTPGECKIGN